MHFYRQGTMQLIPEWDLMMMLACPLLPVTCFIKLFNCQLILFGGIFKIWVGSHDDASLLTPLPVTFFFIKTFFLFFILESVKNSWVWPHDDAGLLTPTNNFFYYNFQFSNYIFFCISKNIDAVQMRKGIWVKLVTLQVNISSKKTNPLPLEIWIIYSICNDIKKVKFSYSIWIT